MTPRGIFRETIVTNSLYAIASGTYAPMLTTLSGLLDKGAAHAKEQSRNPDDLLQANLAADMFTLLMQIRLCCHHAKDGMARLTGGTPPTFENMGGDVKTLAALKEYIAETVALLKGLSANAFEGAENRRIEFPLQGGPMVFESNGLEFLRDWSFGHFYFHAVTAYDILRNQGVPLGKRDYMAHIGPHIRNRG
jgi:uncharacterized protein